MKSSQIEKLRVDFEFEHQQTHEEYYFKGIANEKRQSYSGDCLMGSYHGAGVYRWENDAVYEGSFYSNFKDGYAILSLADNSTFEGLFVRNHAFGPGVLTYANGCQDVGFWVDRKLVRLSRSVDLVVPRLAPTSTAKIKLLQFRRLIPVREDFDPTTESFFEFNYLNDELFAPFSKFVFDPRSLFFNQVLFDRIHFDTSAGILKRWLKSRAQEKELQRNWEQASISESRRSYNEVWKSSFCVCHDESTPDFENNETVDFCKNIKDIPKEDLGLLAYYWKYGSLKNDESDAGNTEEEYRTGSKESENETVEDVHKAEGKSPTKIVSWNRNELCTNMLKAIFHYRAFEGKINLDVAKLMLGVRTGFRRTGEKEKQCLHFLKICSMGPLYAVKVFLCGDQISPELMDARGNNSIMFAAASDQREVIDALLDYGVNVNSFNDEGLTPLNLCLLRKLAKVYGVSDWEVAFLPTSQNKPSDEIRDEEYMREGSISSLSKVFGDGMSVDYTDINSINDQLDKEQLKNSFSISSQINLSKDRRASLAERFGSSHQIPKIEMKIFPESFLKEDFEQTVPKQSEDSYIFELGPSPTSTPENIEQPKFPRKLINPSEAKKIEEIDRTIEKLLERGADPNISEVPKPSVHLALFTKDLKFFKTLLTFGADPDSRLHANEGLLTPLHVLVLLKPSAINANICNLLLEFGANADKETHPKFLMNLEDFPLEPSKGRTPLQLLCMRPDLESMTSNEFLLQIAEMLAKVCDKQNFYGGHSCLTLSMLSGNITLLKKLLKAKFFNPNCILGNNLGTALHVLVSTALQVVTPYDVSVNMCDLLLEAEANPFLKVKSSEKTIGTCIEYGYREIEIERNKRKPSDAEKRKNSNSEKAGLRDHLKDHMKLMEYLESKAQSLRKEISQKERKKKKAQKNYIAHLKQKPLVKEFSKTAKKFKSTEKMNLKKKLLFVIPGNRKTKRRNAGYQDEDYDDYDNDDDEDDDDDDDDDKDGSDNDSNKLPNDDKSSGDEKKLPGDEKASGKSKKGVLDQKSKGEMKRGQKVKEEKKKQGGQDEGNNVREHKNKEKEKKNQNKESEQETKKSKEKRKKNKGQEEDSFAADEHETKKKKKKKEQDKESILDGQKTEGSKGKKKQKKNQDNANISSEQELEQRAKKKKKENTPDEQELKDIRKKKKRQGKDSTPDEQELKDKEKTKKKQGKASTSNGQEVKEKKKKKKRSEDKENKSDEKVFKEKKKKKRSQDRDGISDGRELKKKKRHEDRREASRGREPKEVRKKQKIQEKENMGSSQEYDKKMKAKKQEDRERLKDGEKLKRRGSERTRGKSGLSLSAKLLTAARSETFPEKLRQALLRIFDSCKDFDINKFLFPYVVLRDGNLYYRFKEHSSDRKEQYTLI